MTDRSKRDPWQEAPCYYTGGICQANCSPACMCQNGTLTMQKMFEHFELERLRALGQ